MKFNVSFKIIAEVRDKDILQEFPCRRINRWYYGIYLPRISPLEVWSIPGYAKGSELYIEATYPVGDNCVVTVLDSFGNKIEPIVDRADVAELTTENVVCRGSMMIFIMDAESREVSIRKINVVEENGQAVLVRKRLFHKRIFFSGERFLPSSVGLPKDNFLSMFWGVLVSACNKANIDNLLLKHNGNPISMKPGIVHENSKKKIVLSAGVPMSNGRN